MAHFYMVREVVAEPTQYSWCDGSRHFEDVDCWTPDTLDECQSLIRNYVDNGIPYPEGVECDPSEIRKR